MRGVTLTRDHLLLLSPRPRRSSLEWDEAFVGKYRAIGEWYLARRGDQHGNPDRTPVASWSLTPLRLAGLVVVPVIVATFAAALTLQPAAVGIGLMALVLVMWFVASVTGVRLTPAHLRVTGLRSRTIHWPDVVDIVTEPRFGGTRVVVVEGKGRRTRLPVPRTVPLGSERTFRADLDTLHGTWQAYR